MRGLTQWIEDYAADGEEWPAHGEPLAPLPASKHRGSFQEESTVNIAFVPAGDEGPPLVLAVIGLTYMLVCAAVMYGCIYGLRWVVHVLW
jgi:hypothetical protein